MWRDWKAGVQRTGEPCDSPTTARPLKCGRAEVNAQPAWAGVRLGQQASKPDQGVCPDGLEIVREGGV